MENDRTLLELAARAAGFEVTWHENWQCFVHVEPFNIDSPPTLAGQRMVWNPLTDDGDALRLTVKLNLHVDIEAWSIDVTHGSTLTSEKIYIAGDPYAATRRAIVRAAAEIGRSRGGE